MCGRPVDDAAATLFLAGIAAREAHASGGPVLWASCRSDLYAPGLEQAGLASADLINVCNAFERDTLVRHGQASFFAVPR